jgi:hypothetical protein
MVRFGWPRSRWWPALAFVHRWLGIAGCLLFLVWFGSGIAMMYVRMPELTAAERLAHAPPIAAEAIQVAPARALAEMDRESALGLEVAMLGARPVYRAGGRAPSVVFADTAERLDEVTPVAAAAAAAAFVGRGARMRDAGLLALPDQWTLQLRAHFPLRRFIVDDEAGTELYVSGRTGAVVLDTNRGERRWAYVGPVAHWLYLPVLRRNGPLWTQTIIWASGFGLVLCATGLVAGLLRFSPCSRYRVRRTAAMSPYTGWMKWHHYAGLLFGALTFTWTFSGLLSMGPFAPLTGPGLGLREHDTVTGPVSSFAAGSAQDVRDAVHAAGRDVMVREMEATAFRGRGYWLAREDASRHRLVPTADPTASIERFDRAELETVAGELAFRGALVELTWLDAYDEYYYDRGSARPLPVLRARYSDADATWIYLDPSRGGVALVASRRDRVNRWLYHGLHSLDPAWLRSRRPLWDIVVIGLSLGGIAGAATSLVPALRRLARHVAGLRRGRRP